METSRKTTGNYCWGCSVNSARVLAEAILTGFSQLAFSRRRLVGAAVAATLFAFSPASFAMGLWGALVATLWPFLRQRDLRLLASGWYGSNGAMIGLWTAWLMPAAPVMALTVTAAALVTAVILDAIAIRLGDHPVRLPVLTMPFVLMAAIIAPSAPALYDGYETMADLLSLPRLAVLPAPRSSGATLAQAGNSYASGDFSLARRQFLDVAATDHASAAAWTGAGWAAFKLGDEDAAVPLFRRALSLAPDTGLAHDGLGWTAYNAARFRAAETSFQQALPLPDAHAGLGWIALRDKRPGDAEQHFSDALADNPGLASAREGLGWSLLALRRAGESERLFLGLLDQDSRSHTALQGLADSRRLLLLHGQTRPDSPGEWTALGHYFGWKPVALAVLFLVVILDSPRRGLTGLGACGLSLVATCWLAGSCSILWLDLHLQTVALVGLLVGGIGRFSSTTLFITAAAILAACGIWAASHGMGLSIPLLPFNLAGLAALHMANRHYSRGYLTLDGELRAANALK